MIYRGDLLKRELEIAICERLAEHLDSIGISCEFYRKLDVWDEPHNYFRTRQESPDHHHLVQLVFFDNYVLGTRDSGVEGSRIYSPMVIRVKIFYNSPTFEEEIWNLFDVYDLPKNWMVD